FTIVLGWPAANLKQRLVMILAGIPAAALLLAVTTPFQLAGHVQIYLQQLAGQAGVARAEPLSLTYMIFLESGGRWMLAVALAVLCVGAGQLLPAGKRPAAADAAPPGD
ncbi:MAG: hypothetical protein KJO38_11595, partial [Gammaproteobacteria bacterium]|nr:hypothetical protein [Gammaproteobacteria bacterium]